MGSFNLPTTPLRPTIIQHKFYVYEKNVKNDKKQKLIYFFLWNTGVETSKVVTNSLKKRLCDTNP